jgi:hypothetical protein
MITFKEFIEPKIYVHIDDERPPKKNTNALWLKNYAEALDWVEKLNIDSTLFRVNFDNDIGDITPNHDGYNILKKLLDKVMDGMKMPSEIMIHTQNSENKPAMINYIKNFSIHTNHPIKDTYSEKFMSYNKDLEKDLVVDGLVFVFD